MSNASAFDSSSAFLIVLCADKRRTNSRAINISGGDSGQQLFTSSQTQGLEIEVKLTSKSAVQQLSIPALDRPTPRQAEHLNLL